MKKLAFAAAMAVGATIFAQAQTLTVMNSVEAAHHDPARTTAGSPLISGAINYSIKLPPPIVGRPASQRFSRSPNAL